jgi:hypothetical protein
VVTFTGCEIDTAGVGYTLTATAGTLQSGLSRTFSVNPGPATNLVFTRSPVNTSGAQASTWGTVFSQQPTVAVDDAFGNSATGDTSTVNLAITAGTGPAGANLSCSPSTNQQVAANGFATFSGCRLDKANLGASPYTLSATDGSLQTATSLAFTIGVGLPATVAFTTQPGTVKKNRYFTNPPVVAVLDAAGNPVTGVNITLSLTIPLGGTLTCDSLTTPTDSNGNATFTHCQVNSPGTYTLTASSPGLSATSAPFTVTQ